MNDLVIRCATGFNGGIGSSHMGMCGGLSGGTVLIGAIHGRVNAREDHLKCNQLAWRYHEAFTGMYGCTQCAALQERIKQIDGTQSCRPMLRKAARILTDLLSEA